MSDYSELKLAADNYAALIDSEDRDSELEACDLFQDAARVDVVQGLIADLLCPVCKGSGEGWVMSDSGPDGHHIQADCQECNGRGSLLGAYESMKSQLGCLHDRHIAAGRDLLFMRIERDQLKAENEALRKAASDALKFVAFAFSEGVQGADDAGRAIERAMGMLGHD